MDQHYKSAATELEKILTENSKEVSNDEKKQMRALIKDLKVEVPKKHDVVTQFEALEKSLKKKKPVLLKQIEEIRKSLVTSSMGIVGVANLHVPPEHIARDLELASKIIDGLYKQAMEVNNDQAQGKPENPTTTSSRMGSNIKGQTGPKKTEPDMPSELEKKGTLVLTALKKMENMKREAEQAFKLLDELYKQAAARNDDNVKEKTDKSTKAEQPKGKKGKGNTRAEQKPESCHVLTNTDKFESVSSVLTKMGETNNEAEQAFKLLDELYKQAAAVNDDKVKTKTDKSTKVEPPKAQKEKGNIQAEKKPKSRQVLSHNDKFESVSSVLTKMGETNKQVEKLKHESEFLAGLLEALHDTVTGREDKMSKKKPPTTPGNDLSGYDRASTILKTFQEKENGVSKLKYEIECLEHMLDELKKSVSEGEKEPVALRASAETTDESQAYKSARQIFQKFKEKERNLEVELRRMSQVVSMIKEDEAEKTQNVTTNISKGQQDKETRRKKRSDPAPEVPVSGFPILDGDFQIVLSALGEMKEKLVQMKENERIVEHASELLESLYQQSVPFTKNQAEETTKDATALNKQTDKLKAGGKTNLQAHTGTQSDASLKLDKRCRVVSLALKKLEEMKGEAEHASQLLDQLYQKATAVNGDQVKERTVKPTKDKPSDGEKGKEYTQDKTKPKTYEEKFKSVLLALRKMEEANKDAQSHVEEKQLLESILDHLFVDVQDLVEGKTSKTQSALGQIIEPIDNEKESPTITRLEQAKKIYEVQVSLKSEAQYAARLLDELSNFSQTTKEGVDRKLLSDPPTGTEPGRNTSDRTSAEKSQIASQQTQRNKRLWTHFEKASTILNQIKERQNLRDDIERETKQSEERLRKLQRLNVENSELKKDIDQLRTRLSEIAGAKLTHENPTIADLSDPNRPTKLGEKYSELYDNQWTDAFATLSKYDADASDEKLAGYLYDIIIDGYRFCESVRMTQKKNIEDIMLHPDVSMGSNQGRETEKVNEIFAKLLSDAAKVSSNLTSVNMVKAFVGNDEMKKKYGKMMVPCKTYIEECVKLCWYMQVQTPPVFMDLKTAKKQTFQKDAYREYTSKGTYIAFVVWPALLLHEGGPLLVKGVAQGE